MNDAFRELEKHKQDKILNAAMKEFAENGYAHASTNHIVKAAEISKGMLFYYFNSKLELYHDLTQYCLSYIEDEYIPLVQNTPVDFFEKYRYLSLLKLKSFHDKPELFFFTRRIYLDAEEDPVIKKTVDRMLAIREGAIANAFADADMSRFRNDIPIEQQMRLIQCCMGGYEQELIQKLKEIGTDDTRYTALWDEFYAFLDSLKLVFYQSTAINKQ